MSLTDRQTPLPALYPTSPNNHTQCSEYNRHTQCLSREYDKCMYFTHLYGFTEGAIIPELLLDNIYVCVCVCVCVFFFPENSERKKQRKWQVVWG